MAIDKSLKIIISAVDNASAQLGNINQAFFSLSKGIIAAETAIIGMSAAAAGLTTKLGSELVQTASEYADGLLDIVAVVGKTGASHQELSGILDSLVAQFPITGKEGASAMEQIAQMGFTSAKEIDNLSRASLELSIATKTDLQTAIGAVLPLMQAYKINVEDVGRVTNLLAAAQFSGASSVEDLKEGLKFIAPIASMAGIQMEELVAAMELMKNMGLEASQTGTQLRGAITNLLDPPAKAKEALAELGVSTKDLQANMHSIAGIIDLFKGKTISATQAAALFGKQNVAVAGLINDGADKLRNYTKSVTDTTAAFDAYTAKSQKYEVVMNNLGGTWDVMKKTIGEGLLPEVIKLMGVGPEDGIRGVISRIAELEKSSHGIGQPLIEAFNTMKTAAQDIFGESIGGAEGFYNLLTQIAQAAKTNIEIWAIWISEGAKLFKEQTEGADLLTTLLRAVNTAIGGIALTVSAIRDAFAMLWFGIEVGVAATLTVVNDMKKGLLSLAISAAEAADAMPGIDFSDKIKNLEKARSEIKDVFNPEPPKLWTDNAVNALVAADEAVTRFSEKSKKSKDILEEPVEIKVDSEQIETAEDRAKNFQDALEMLGIKEYKPKIDTTEIEHAEKDLSGLEDINIQIDAVKLEIEKKEFSQATDEARNELLEIQGEINALNDESLNLSANTDSYEDAGGRLVEIRDKIKELEAKKAVIAVSLNADTTQKEISELNKQLTSLYDKRSEVLEIKAVTPDPKIWGEVEDKYTETIELVNGKPIVFKTKIDEESKQEVIKDVDILAMKGKEKLSDFEKFQLSLEKEKFKADLKMAELDAKQSHDLIKKNMDYDLKIKTESMKAATEIAKAKSEEIKAAFDSLGESIGAVSGGIGDMFGALADFEGSQLQYERLMDIMKEQMRNEERLIDAQIELAAAEKEKMAAETERLKDPTQRPIEVSVVGDTTTWLKGLMQELFKTITAQARQEIWDCFGAE